MSDAFDVPTEIADVTVVNTSLNPVPVTGTITVVPSGTQDVNIVSSAINVPVTVQNFPATQTVAISQTGTDNNVDANITNASLAVTGPLTDTELRASPVPVTIPTPVPVTDNGGSLTVDGTVTALQGTSPWVVSGTIATSPNVNVHDGTGVSISSTGSSLNVDVTNTVPVTGPLTDTQLRASPVPVSGTVAVSNFPATQPVSGTVTANQGTPAAIANAWPIKLTDGTDTADITAASALKVDGSAVTQPISAASLPLPTGASTAANQATGNASLASIDAGIPAALGQTTMAASMPVVIASDQSAIAVSGTVTTTFPVGTLNNGAETAVAGTAVSVLAANANRKKLIVQNTGIANVRLGTTGVTATTGVRLAAGTTTIMDMPHCPTNAIFAIREGAVSSTVLAQEVV